MSQEVDTHAAAQAVQPPPLKISRLFHAPRETVFKAWTSAEHVKRWFSPEGCSIPEATVEPRVGGRFDIHMRLPNGQMHNNPGVIVEMTPPSRLVIDMHPADDDGKPLFRAYTEIELFEALGGTRMEVTQTYTLLQPNIAIHMVGGASEGWRTTLDKLDREVIGMRGGGEVEARSVAHGVFNLERTYDAPVARVWKALTDETAKAKWFAGTPDTWTLVERHMDVRPGGRERLKGRWESGLVTTFDATYHDVIPMERLVYSYEMHMDEKKISVSLATMQLKAEGAKTTLMVTEQGAFLDGYDDAGSREHGTGLLLNAIGASLAE